MSINGLGDELSEDSGYDNSEAYARRKRLQAYGGRIGLGASSASAGIGLAQHEMSQMSRNFYFARMSGFTKAFRSVSGVGRAVSRLGLVTAVGGSTLDIYSYNQGNISGSRLSYRLVGSGLSVAAPFAIGGPPGWIAGGLIGLGSWLGEEFYDHMWSPFMDRVEWQMYNFESQWRNGWRP